ncbi:hypothetical protein BN971_02136 [Mycobacterium bohemicum DSM 44277]|uniref:Secreted protein n=2 Tax=Mycobacterium bohemicum TaxID=56425 RepID=A0A1X1QW73_MYCBE|nr:hypothetical protein [Mycobacterium bohemicum]MCV6969770.1 hypothetical protein [Mycobacterium bohemicum]ORU95536.1 hypothetical protein AWB93_24500 [Mycobacterium bohemicum]CPR10865.1 hypothetical protein BN971_02136 [Mycobacterium bohemicum DSM 44277]
MHTTARAATCSGAIAAVMLPVTTFAAAAEGGTTVVLDNKLRRCDFSLVQTAAWVPAPALADGTALIHRAGSRVVADVHLYDEPESGTHFDVGLIEEPRAATSSCGPGDAGTAFTGLDTDGAGNGAARVQDTVRPGTTGVWVVVERSNTHSQNPGEFYTSEFLAPV